MRKILSQHPGIRNVAKWLVTRKCVTSSHTYKRWIICKSTCEKVMEPLKREVSYANILAFFERRRPEGTGNPAITISCVQTKWIGKAEIRDLIRFWRKAGADSILTGEIWPRVGGMSKEAISKEVGGVVFLADRGRLLSWFGIKQIVCLNKGLGPTVLGRGDADREIGELCRRVASASGVTGLTGVDFVRSRDRGLLLIDSHLGRMSPMQHFDRLYQVDFAASLRRHLQGVPFDVTAPLKGPAFIKFPEVLQLAMQGSLGKLLKETNFPVKMPLSPPGDPLGGIRSALAVTTSQARVTLGRWRRLIFSGR